VSHDHQSITVWHVPTLTALRRVPRNEIRQCTLSPDRKHLAVSDRLGVTVFRIAQ
jgi:hypothetical protein